MADEEQLAKLQAQLAKLQEDLAAQQTNHSQQLALLQEQHLQSLQQQQQKTLSSQQVSPLPVSSGVDTAACYRVTPKLPPFWPAQPAIWFTQVEAQFSLAQITSDKTKYDYVVGNLDHRFASEISDLMLNPPAENRYQTLKTLLIQRVSLSEDQRVRQLLTAEELGDTKPSQLLRRMRSLIGTTHVEDSFLRTLWLQRLPLNAQAILQAQVTTIPLDQLADMADRIVAVVPPPNAPTIHAVRHSTENSALAQRVEELSKQLQDIQARLRKPVYPRTWTRNRSLPHPARSTDISQRPAQPVMCYYHRKFGVEARRCIQPCTANAVNPVNYNSDS